MPPEGSYLAATARRLNIPPRRRLDMIEELAADLEALQAAYECRGLSPAAARREALMRLVPAEESLHELNAQHVPRTARWLKADGIGGGVEQFGAAAAAILAGTALLTLVPTEDVAVQGALFIWAQALIAALLAANWRRGAAGLWIMGVLPPEVRSLFQARQGRADHRGGLPGGPRSSVAGLHRPRDPRGFTRSGLAGRAASRPHGRHRDGCGDLRRTWVARPSPAAHLRRVVRAPHRDPSHAFTSSTPSRQLAGMRLAP